MQRPNKSAADGVSGCHVVAQAQSLGGAASHYRNHPGRGYTSHSWRDETTLVISLDCFYSDHSHHPFARSFALDWQAQNDAAFPHFQSADAVDRRLFWGAFYSTTGSNSWRCFYEPAIHDRILALKHAYDPIGVFTPNLHCIGQMGEGDPLPRGLIESAPYANGTACSDVVEGSTAAAQAISVPLLRAEQKI